jgi:hypothetical protein
MDAMTIKEFEVGWNEMLETYDCKGHAHLSRMWKAREKFVPAYFRGVFCPFTRTTGRSESFNSNFKEYVKRNDTIETFLKQYELFQENVIEIENEDRFMSTQQQPVLWCRQPIERHAAQIYTRGIYLKFATELVNATAFGVTEVVKDQVYELKRLFQYDNPEYKKILFTVFVDRNDMSIECECGKFEKDGLLCCHILRLFTQWDVVKIPDQYIMRRWTTEFREQELMKHKQESLEVHGSAALKNALWFATLMNNLNGVCADISRDADKSKEFIEEVHKLHKRLMSDSVRASHKDINRILLKDPPVIKKASTKKNKDKESEVGSVPESPTSPSGPSIDIWVNADGSTTHMEQVMLKPDKLKNQKKNKENEHESVPNCLKDPPVSSCKSVNKGNRLKPQSEKNSKRKRNSKNKKS